MGSTRWFSMRRGLGSIEKDGCEIAPLLRNASDERDVRNGGGFIASKCSDTMRNLRGVTREALGQISTSHRRLWESQAKWMKEAATDY